LKLKLDKKSIDKLKERLDIIEEETRGEETDYEIEARFAKVIITFRALCWWRSDTPLLFIILYISSTSLAFV
jgi:hypothetical protein